jgi:hypothetical protein
VLRTVSPTSFAEDPLRLVRGLRFVSQLGLDPDESTLQQMRDEAKSIRFVSDRRKEPWFGMGDANLYEVLADVVKPVGEAGMRLLVDIDGAVGRFDEASDGRIVTVGNLNPEQARSYDQDDLLLATGPWPAHCAPLVNSSAVEGSNWIEPPTTA